MPKAQSRTKFFESIVEDRNVPAAQVELFFVQAYREREGDPNKQLRLLDLLKKHRPELENQVASRVIQGRYRGR